MKRGFVTMNETIEDQVRATFAAELAEFSATAAERLCCLDYPVARPRGPMFAKLGATAAALVAAGTTAIMLLSSGTPVAFARWSSVPKAPTAAALETAEAKCGAAVRTHLLAAEQRGPYISLLYSADDKPWQCITDHAHVLLNASNAYPTHLYAPIPPDKLMDPNVEQQAFGSDLAALRRHPNASVYLPPRGNKDARYLVPVTQRGALILSGPDSVTAVAGAAGTDVTSVMFILADGTHVSATVQHGWYVAWWPGAAKPGGAEVKAVSVGTRSTTVSSGPAGTELTSLDSQTQSPTGCKPGRVCSVFVAAKLTPEVAASLRNSFALFRNTPPTPARSETRAVRELITKLSSRPIGDGLAGRRNLGLDPAQTRVLTQRGLGTLVVVPGSEGLCVFLLHGGGGGECGPLKIKYGVIADSQTGQSYYLFGLVPNGTTRVAVHLESGTTRELPVRNNATVARFTSKPQWYRLPTTDKTITLP
jgi:hypothetical protein